MIKQIKIKMILQIGLNNVTHQGDSSHLSRRRPETDRSTAPYAHNSRPLQRKGEDAGNPRHGGTTVADLGGWLRGL